MIRNNKEEGSIVIGKRNEYVVIDNDTRLVSEIIDQLIECEKEKWLKNFFLKLKRGCSDISIISDIPVERTKYYNMKEKFINKIYQCCIFKGIVSYEDIINERID